jgi:hypothetical protein
VIYHIDDTTPDGQELSSCQATYGVSNLSRPGRVALPSGDCPIGSLLVVSNVQGEMCSNILMEAEDRDIAVKIARLFREKHPGIFVN